MSDPTIVYCGCIRRPGHFDWISDKGRLRQVERADRDRLVIPWESLDRMMLWGVDQFAPQGTESLTHTEGWTILCIADRTIDSRTGSHLTFAMRGSLTRDEVWRHAEETFPQVTERLRAALGKDT